MTEAQVDAVDLITKVDPEKKDFHLFLQVFLKYNRLELFLDTIKDPEKKKALLKDFIFGLNVRNRGLERAVAISETLYSLNESVEISSELEKYLKQAYEEAQDNEKILYGLIASMYNARAKTEKEFFNEMSKKYPVENPREIKAEDLVNKNKEFIQRYFFYDDKDGEASFESMMKTYQADRSWQMEDKSSYVLITKTGASGMKILKYANKPRNLKGNMDIEEVLEKKDLSTIEVVHRGHSYHAPNTIWKIPKNARIVFLGSCGGFNNIKFVLDKAENAHIIATKGTGTMQINDPLLKMIDEIALDGKGIEWNDLWAYAGSEIDNPFFNEYINPANNASIMLINAYRKHAK